MIDLNVKKVLRERCISLAKWYAFHQENIEDRMTESPNDEYFDFIARNSTSSVYVLKSEDYAFASIAFSRNGSSVNFEIAPVDKVGFIIRRMDYRAVDGCDWWDIDEFVRYCYDIVVRDIKIKTSDR